MTKHLIIIAIWFVLSCGAAFGQNDSAKTADETAIRVVVQSVADAWTAGDGKKFGEPFAEHADYIVVNGLLLKGREAIAQSHQRIFDTIFKNTKLKLEIRQIRFVRSDVAVVHTGGNIVSKNEAFPAAHAAFPTFVLSKDRGKWQIIAFQNTANAAGGENKN
jgi:uncharacterized protein (TIGR02246 family)